MKWKWRFGQGGEVVAHGTLSSEYQAAAKATYKYVLEQESASEGAMSLAQGQDDYLFEFSSGSYDMARKIREKFEEEGLERRLRLR